MTKPASRKTPDQESIALLQDIFILLAIDSGMSVESIRKHLKVNKWRVSNISKHIKLARNAKL